MELQRTKNLIVEGKITLFKTLETSKIIHLSQVTNYQRTKQNIKKNLSGMETTPKIENITLCNKYENCGLKNVNILSKIISSRCSWINRLYDTSSHPWKIITY